MISCPRCGDKIKIDRKQHPIKLLDSTEIGYKFSLCWVVNAPFACEKCGTPVPIELLKEELPIEVPISAGAAMMANRSTKRFDHKRGTDAANKRHSKKHLSFQFNFN